MTSYLPGTVAELTVENHVTRQGVRRAEGFHTTRAFFVSGEEGQAWMLTDGTELEPNDDTILVIKLLEVSEPTKKQFNLEDELSKITQDLLASFISSKTATKKTSTTSVWSLVTDAINDIIKDSDKPDPGERIDRRAEPGIGGVVRTKNGLLWQRNLKGNWVSEAQGNQAFVQQRYWEGLEPDVVEVLSNGVDV